MVKSKEREREGIIIGGPAELKNGHHAERRGQRERESTHFLMVVSS